MSPRGPKLILISAGVLLGLGLAAIFVLAHPPSANGANRMTISAGCHGILASPFEVANTREEDLGETLVPPNPVKGLICRYVDFNDVRLYRAVVLTPGQAGLIASTLDQIHSKPPRGINYGCGGPGQSYDFFILGYGAREDVDVLSNPYGGPDGCPAITNGRLSFAGASGLLDLYVDSFAGPLPIPTCGSGMTMDGRPAPCPSDAWLPFGSVGAL